MKKKGVGGGRWEPLSNCCTQVYNNTTRDVLENTGEFHHINKSYRTLCHQRSIIKQKRIKLIQTHYKLKLTRAASLDSIMEIHGLFGMLVLRFKLRFVTPLQTLRTGLTDSKESNLTEDSTQLIHSRFAVCSSKCYEKRLHWKNKYSLNLLKKKLR